VSRLDDELSQILDPLGELGIDCDPPAHRFTSMQHRGVVTPEPTPDLRQAGARQQ
jgi:hypothetical protein